LIAMTCLSTLLTGCAKKSGGGSSTGGTGTDPGAGTTPANYVYLPHNWQFVVTPSTLAAGATPYTASGVIDEQPSSSVSHYVTSVLSTNDPCFVAPAAEAPSAGVVPLDGSVNGPRMQMTSFAVGDQVVSIDAQKNAATTQLSGTYKIAGGCANGQSGTLTGNSYTDFSGSYSGVPGGQANRTIKLDALQEQLGTGLGTFIMRGNATFGGFSCFTSGTIVPGGSYVRGSGVVLRITANDAAATQVLLNGNIDTAASTFTVSSANINSGACSGSLGTFALTK